MNLMQCQVFSPHHGRFKLQVKYAYSGKSFLLTPYKTHQEKDLLLFDAVGGDVDRALEVCGMDVNDYDLSMDEKIAMLLKFREISVGADVNVEFKCSFCNATNQNEINIENIVMGATKTADTRIKDCFKEITDENVSDFIGIETSDMDLDEYEDLITHIRESVTKFNFSRKSSCQKCSKDNYIDVKSFKFVISIMSEDSLMSLYQTYNDLIFHGNYSKQDIDTMYPFERVIFVNLLNKSQEDST